jgi:hypothetical protein
MSLRGTAIRGSYANSWRRNLKVMLGIAVAYVALNIVCVLCDNRSERIPVNIAISVLDATNARPVSHAVASWQARATDLDCQHIVSLLNESARIRSSKDGIFSPSEFEAWEFALVSNELGMTDKGISINVIGMTAKDGRLEFRARLGRKLKWALPHLGPVDARNRILQVDALGYKSKHISLRPEDFSLVGGEYTVNITVLLDPETGPR